MPQKDMWITAFLSRSHVFLSTSPSYRHTSMPARLPSRVISLTESPSQSPGAFGVWLSLIVLCAGQARLPSTAVQSAVLVWFIRRQNACLRHFHTLPFLKNILLARKYAIRRRIVGIFHVEKSLPSPQPMLSQSTIQGEGRVWSGGR